MTKSKPLYKAYEFLNKTEFHEDSSIFALITEEHYETGKGKKMSHYTKFRITDCGESLDISLRIDNSEDKTNTIYKIDKLISHLTKFKDEIKKIKK